MFTIRSTLVVLALSAAACAKKNDGFIAAAPSPAPVASKGDTLPTGITPAMIKDGSGLFNNGSCAKCHGINGTQGQYGPSLADRKWVQIKGTYPEIVDIIVRGVPGSQQKLSTSNPEIAMRPRGGMNYQDDAIAKIAAYVWSLSHGS